LRGVPERALIADRVAQRQVAAASAGRHEVEPGAFRIFQWLDKDVEYKVLGGVPERALIADRVAQRQVAAASAGRHEVEPGAFRIFQWLDKDVEYKVLGGVPERSKGADCKSAGFAFVGSNPTPSIRISSGRSSMVEPQPSKLMVWVRFPSPAFVVCVIFPLYSKMPT
jgi:hypothetical protein